MLKVSTMPAVLGAFFECRILNEQEVKEVMGMYSTHVHELIVLHTCSYLSTTIYILFTVALWIPWQCSI